MDIKCTVTRMVNTEKVVDNIRSVFVGLRCVLLAKHVMSQTVHLRYDWSNDTLTSRTNTRFHIWRMTLNIEMQYINGHGKEFVREVDVSQRDSYQREREAPVSAFPKIVKYSRKCIVVIKKFMLFYRQIYHNLAFKHQTLWTNIITPLLWIVYRELANEQIHASQWFHACREKFLCWNYTKRHAIHIQSNTPCEWMDSIFLSASQANWLGYYR